MITINEQTDTITGFKYSKALAIYRAPDVADRYVDDNIDGRMHSSEKIVYQTGSTIITMGPDAYEVDDPEASTIFFIYSTKPISDKFVIPLCKRCAALESF